MKRRNEGPSLDQNRFFILTGKYHEAARCFQLTCTMYLSVVFGGSLTFIFYEKRHPIVVESRKQSPILWKSSLEVAVTGRVVRSWTRQLPHREQTFPRLLLDNLATRTTSLAFPYARDGHSGTIRQRIAREIPKWMYCTWSIRAFWTFKFVSYCLKLSFYLEILVPNGVSQSWLAHRTLTSEFISISVALLPQTEVTSSVLHRRSHIWNVITSVLYRRSWQRLGQACIEEEKRPGSFPIFPMFVLTFSS